MVQTFNYFLCFIFAFHLAYAQTPGADPSGSNKAELPWRGGVLYSMANKISFSGRTSGLSFSSEEGTTGSLGLLIEKSFYISTSGSATVGVSYELSRDISSSSGQIGGSPYSTNYANKPNLNIINLYGNYNALLNDQVDLYFGLNYSTLNLGNSTLSARGGIGYQLGVNYKVLTEYSLQFEYRIIQGTATGSILGSPTTADSATFNGFILAVKKVF